MQKVKYSSAPDQVVDVNHFIEPVMTASVKVMTIYALFVIVYLFLYGLIDLKKVTPSQTNNGFYILAPYLTDFKAYRNIGYLAYIVLFVIGGCATFFLKSALVKQSLASLVKPLILLTFSYALAGLLLDIVQVVKMIYASN